MRRDTALADSPVVVFTGRELSAEEDAALGESDAAVEAVLEEREGDA